ncbi:tRNA (adenosine(37)-N6)-threonylcarbamoyltransferase complex dimerization subunit type 1 TsaB [Parapedobacter sp. DT-150]|uniref:tRNA (adenosine(37)-N6)-threonylcarbamoyltransferase complex dimerization subunit type 1 TsaB n=1 Tax=Parapedobacter sp. DT-150 TaxID=3396162 RepID=UPI003F1C6DC6
MPKHVILQIETATQVCSVALSANGDPLAFRDIDEPNVHASRLTLLIADVLREASLTFADLAAVAVSKGPGSYTGLRIGVSTAKGLAYARDLPLIGIDTLAAMAAGFAAEHAAVDADTWLCPMIDARRMEVYSAVYDQQLRPVSATQATIIDHASFDDLPPERRIVLFGSGADKLAALFEDSHHVAVVPGFKNSARYLSRLAHQAFMRKDVVDVVYFEPYYLKDFVATLPKK